PAARREWGLPFLRRSRACRGRRPGARFSFLPVRDFSIRFAIGKPENHPFLAASQSVFKSRGF
ncbi:hypothetical protein, partial [Desulfatibacillum alkenivorans]|uniref:hypothetical protein n=1 Tax=Desulfatibacillum alkenivorans TaxID=259354 RepID=UPI001B8D55FC